jgi:3-deoxy-D-manno-octulosonic-acid transferase
LLFLETEIWPNLVREAYRRGIPTIMLSGRLSDKALSRYELARPFFRHVLAQYTALGMQSREDAARMLKLGAPEKKVSVVGNLKFAVDGVVSGRENVVRSTVPDRQVLVAGSTHRGEELALLRALQLARDGIPKLMMVLAPRHPERFSEVEKLLRESSFSFERKTTLQPDQYFQKDVLLLDTVGELTEFFNAADLAFVGGSLVDAGGHNILEPARCRKPVLFGPYMENFRTIAEGMKRNGGAIEVHDAEDLARVLAELLRDPQARQQMGQSAADFAATHQQALPTNLALARRYL